MSRRGDYGDKIIIFLKSDGRRRHKSWCEHHRSSDDFCSARCAGCIGTAFCGSYRNKYGEDDVFYPKAPDEGAPTENGAEESPKRDREELYRLAAPGEKLLGRLVLVRNTPYTFRIGRVMGDSFDTFSAEWGGRIHKYDKRTALRNESVYVYVKSRYYTPDGEEEYI